MTPPLLGVGDEEAQSNVTLLASSNSVESLYHNRSEIKERNYMGLSDCSSVGSSTISSPSEQDNGSLNLKATELRLALPGSPFPDGDSELRLSCLTKFDEKPLFPLRPLSIVNGISGSKQGFSGTVDTHSGGQFHSKSELNVMLSPTPSSLDVKSSSLKDNLKLAQDVKKENYRSANPNAASTAPATKAQVVGWPPIRSFRKNSLATTSKNNDREDGKVRPYSLFVKVSMDGAPYLRKVELNTHTSYKDLASALEKMFSCFTIGHCGSHGASAREVVSERTLQDLLNGLEYVLTYEDKDGDWMRVGDVPWEMFVTTCKRLRIMKSSDANGLATREAEKIRGKPRSC